MEKTVEKNERIYGIDLVKIFAIVWICLYHFMDFSYGWRVGSAFFTGNLFDFFWAGDSGVSLILKVFLAFGVFGVNLFIIASGVGLAMSSERRGLDWRDFFRRRFLKIFPLYYFLLLGVSFLMLFRGRSIDFFDFFTHFLGIHSIFPDYTYSISTPFWYIGVIVQLYLLFPLIYGAAKKVNWLVVLTGALVLQLLLTPYLTSFVGGGRFFSEFLFDFTFGIILGNILFKRPKMFQDKWWILMLLVSLFFIFLLAGYYVKGICGVILFPLSAATMFMGLLPLGAYCRSKICIKLAVLSFPVYLTHYFLLTWLWIKLPVLKFWVGAVLFLIGAFVLGWVFNKCFDLISIQYAKIMLRLKH